jgi:hypothetical protein
MPNKKLAMEWYDFAVKNLETAQCRLRLIIE